MQSQSEQQWKREKTIAVWSMSICTRGRSYFFEQQEQQEMTLKRMTRMRIPPNTLMPVNTFCGHMVNQLSQKEGLKYLKGRGEGHLHKK